MRWYRLRMRTRWRPLVGGGIGAVAAVVWAVSLAIYQPFMEPTWTWTDPTTGQVWPPVAGNNTYWPREIRHLAILLAAAALILACAAGRRAVLIAGSLTFGWLVVDLWLDRVDVAGPTTAVW